VIRTPPSNVGLAVCTSCRSRAVDARQVRFDARPDIGRQRRDALDRGTVCGRFESDQALEARQQAQAPVASASYDVLHDGADEASSSEPSTDTAERAAWLPCACLASSRRLPRSDSRRPVFYVVARVWHFPRPVASRLPGSALCRRRRSWSESPGDRLRVATRRHAACAPARRLRVP
jgi:hypothetical protein